MSKYPTNFVSIDFETAYPQRASICSVGCVKYIDNKPENVFYSLVQPKWDIITEGSPSNCNIHGIFDRELLDKPEWPEILYILEDFCKDLPLVAHNASFEKSCITKANEAYNITETTLNLNFIDTLKVVKEVEKLFGFNISGAGARKLLTLCEMYHVPVKDHHNALSDAFMCGDLLVKFNEIFSMDYKERGALGIKVIEPVEEHLPAPGSCNLDLIM